MMLYSQGESWNNASMIIVVYSLYAGMIIAVYSPYAKMIIVTACMQEWSLLFTVVYSLLLLM